MLEVSQMVVLATVVTVWALLWAFPGRSRRFTRWATLFVLCALVFPGLLIVSSAALLSRVTWLDPAFHRAVIQEVKLAPALSAALSKEVSGFLIEHVKLMPPLRTEAERLLEGSISRVATSEWVEQELNLATDKVLGFLNGSRHSLGWSLDLRERKAQAMQFLTRTGAAGSVREEAGKALARLPDEVSADAPQFAQMEMALSRLRPGVQMVLLAGPVGLLLAVMAGLAAWLVAGQGQVAVRWLEAGLLEAGAAVVVLASLAKPLILQLSAGFNPPPFLAAVPLQAWFEVTVFRLSAAWQFVGAGIIGAGLVLLASPLLLRRRRAPPAAG